jgi:hypothetical protein
MLYRTLGSTGETVSAIGLGGWHLGLKHVDEQLSYRIARTAVDRGVTFLDNSWDYNGGASEIRCCRSPRSTGSTSTRPRCPSTSWTPTSASIFDSTAQHPERLGEEPPRVRELMPG